MTNPWLSSSAPRGDAYDRRWAELGATGADIHGEAGLLERLGVGSVLDAGCGTGRVAIELARRGHDVVGVDLDPAMLDAARRKAPQIPWVLGDLTGVDIGREFDAVVMAGNVMIFVAPGREGAVLDNLARHLVRDGLLIAGFSLRPGGLDLPAYDRLAGDAGLVFERRFATWDEDPYAGGDYAVSLHRRSAAAG